MPQCTLITVLLCCKRKPRSVGRHPTIDTALEAAIQRLAGLRQAGRRVAGAARNAAEGVRSRLAQAETPPDPVLEAGAPPLPGTGSRSFWVGLVVVTLSVVWALATFLILTNLTPIAPREEVVYVVLFVNLLLIVAMVAVIAVHAAGLWRAWEKKVAGARLHARIVGLFCLIAALRAVLMAFAATNSISLSV